jgi:glucose dehydrogenase
MSETRKLAAILVADVVGCSRLAALLLMLLLPAARAGAAEYYGYDQGGSRFAPLDQITPENVDQLIPAWTYHTGDLESRAPDVLKRSKFEATPILTGEKLVACTPFNAVVALDPGSGRELWRYDPEIKTDYRPANMFACRGVAVWHGPAGAAGPCAERILTATADLRLIALDLKDGKPCADFGQDGAVRIDPGKPLLWPGEFQFTSPPAVIGDLVILGSSIGDNQRVDAPRGTVRAFDVRTGPHAGAGTPCRSAPTTRMRRAGAMAGGRPAPPMSGRRSLSTRRAACCSCRPPARARISMAVFARATIAAPIPWSPSRPRPA